MSPREVLELFPAPSFRHEIQKQALLQIAEAFFENDYKVVLLQAPTGSGKCVKAGTLVNTTKGLIPIEEIELNQEVYTYRDGKIEIGKVTRKFHFKNQKTIKVVTRCGYELEGTRDHKIVVYSNGLKWKRLEELSEEDYVLIVAQPVEGTEVSINFIPKNRIRRSRKDGKRHYFVPKKIDEDLAWFIGLYLAEGNIVEHNGAKRVNITTSKELLERIEEVLGRWNQQYSVKQKKGTDCITVEIFSPNMVDFLKYLDCGDNAFNKKIPKIFFRLPISHRASLVRGLFDGDGYLSARGIGISLVSSHLIKDLQKLLLSIGVLTIIRHKKVKYNGETRTVFDLKIVHESVERFYDLVGEFYTSSKQNFEELINRKRNTNIVTIPMKDEIWSIWEFYKRYQKRNMKNGRKKVHSKKFEVIRRGGQPSYRSLKIAIDAVSGVVKSVKIDHPVKKALEFFENLLELWESGIIILFDKVKKIEESEADVYDLTVEPDHNYISNGFISHNSLLNTAIARAFKSAYLTTPQIPLLEQLINDRYIKNHVKFVKGREHYPCILQHSLTSKPLTAAQAECRKVKNFNCPKKHECPYYKAKREALEAQIAGMTFAYFLYERGLHFGQRELLVVDECHTAESWAFIHSDVEIDTSNFPIRIKIPELKSEDDVRYFVEEIYSKIITVIKRYERKASLESLTDRELRYYDWLRRVEASLKIYVEEDGKDWLFEVERGAGSKGGDILRLKPLYAASTLRRYVWNRADRYLLSSATILHPEEFLDSIGLRADDVKLIDVPSYFPKENRKTYCIPVGKMTKTEMELTFPKLADILEKIFRKHEGEKGFIHCHSYDLQRRLAEEMIRRGYDDRVVVHNGEDRNKKLVEWMSRLDDSVFFSVNMTEGIDLKYDLARWQVLVKSPFPNLADRRVRAKLDRNEWHWYNLQTLRTIIQACGRVVRSHDDYGVTYILDSSIINLIRKYRKYCPRWFLEQLAFVRVS